jgi:hypothetical protein
MFSPLLIPEIDEIGWVVREHHRQSHRGDRRRGRVHRPRRHAAHVVVRLGSAIGQRRPISTVI